MNSSLFSAVREQGQVRLEALDLVQVETPVQPSPVESPLERSSQIQKKYWIGAVAAVTTVTLISLVIRRKQLAKGRGMKSAFDPGKTFARVRQAYDLQRLAASRVIVVGVGGGTSCVENLARAGVGEFILIDRDIISETNLATQQSYRKDIGRPKVQCVAERIRDINPHARVVCKTKMLDEIDDGDFEHFFSKPLGKRPPAVSLLCGFTDCFFAQARVNRLALHFGVPSLCAQVYRQGRGAEVTFMHPLTTPACHRCALSSRYTAYLEEDFKNDVTSEGSPIFATSRLNALKGFIAMALLHQGTEHWRWATLLERIGDRSLVQIRMDPDLNLPVFEKVFGGDEHHRILFDEAVWLPQKPNCPENGYPACPDCGGSGDLRTAIGTFQDTRLMRK